MLEPLAASTPAAAAAAAASVVPSATHARIVQPRRPTADNSEDRTALVCVCVLCGKFSYVQWIKLISFLEHGFDSEIYLFLNEC